MTKGSKNLGITKACPECRKTSLMGFIFIGSGTGKTKCPHCKSLLQIDISQKTIITLTKIAVFGLFIGIAVCFYSLNKKIDAISQNIQASLDIIQQWNVKIIN